MDSGEFQKLRYGNVIARSDGQMFIVRQVTRDKEGNAKHVGLLPAIGIGDASAYSVVSRDRQIGYIQGQTIHED